MSGTTTCWMAFLGGSAGGGELLLVLLVALLLFGAKSLPQIARALGRSLEEIRRAAHDVKEEVMKASASDSETNRDAATARLNRSDESPRLKAPAPTQESTAQPAPDKESTPLAPAPPRDDHERVAR